MYTRDVACKQARFPSGKDSLASQLPSLHSHVSGFSSGSHTKVQGGGCGGYTPGCFHPQAETFRRQESASQSAPFRGGGGRAH